MRFRVKRIFAGRGRAAGREAGKSKKQGAGKIIPRALVVDLIGLFIVGQGTVPCPKKQGAESGLAPRALAVRFNWDFHRGAAGRPLSHQIKYLYYVLSCATQQPFFVHYRTFLLLDTARDKDSLPHNPNPS